MARSSVVIVTAVALIPTSVSINVSPTSGTIPFPFTVTGRLADVTGVGIQGKPIKLYINGTLAGTVTSGTDGSYYFTGSITYVGQFQFQTEFLGDATYEGCTVHDGTHGLLEEAKPSLVLPLLAGGLLLVGAVWLLKS